MKEFLALVFSLSILWAASVFLGSHPVWRYNDEATGLQLPACGSRLLHFTEGYGVSHYGPFGLNPVVATPGNAKKPFFLLHGDSFVEARNVSDAQKPDAVMTRAFADRAVVYGVGRSGFGFPSMIVRAVEYERALGKPVAHIFLCASGIRSDVFEDDGDEFVKSSNGFAKRVMPISALKKRYAGVVNRLHLNFIVDLHKMLAVQQSKWRFPGKPLVSAVKASENDLRSNLDYIMDAMTRQLSAPVVIVYCPNLPRVSKGAVHRDNIECSDAVVLGQCAEAHGILVIDATPALLGLYDQRAKMARGFANCGGPGNGHLNEDGIKAVFGYVDSQLKERYGL